MNEHEAKQFVADLVAGAHNKGNLEQEQKALNMLFQLGAASEELL